MNRSLQFLIALGIGFIVRFALELAFPYSAIGFDPMAYYVPLLYGNVNFTNVLHIGPLYYALALGLNDLIRNPIFSIKLLDSIVSGVFLSSLYYFSSKVIKGRYQLLFCIAAFLGYQSMALSWGLERDLLAFAMFFFLVAIDGHSAKSTFARITLIVLSGFTDPSVVPVEFVWFTIRGIRNSRYFVFSGTSAAVALSYLYAYSYLGGNVTSLITSFLVPANDHQLAFAIIVLAATMYVPFSLMFPHFISSLRSLKLREINPTICLIVVLLITGIVVNYFLYRYVMIGSIVLLASLQSVKLKDKKRIAQVAAVIAVTIFLSAGFVASTSTHPDPIFSNTWSIESQEVAMNPPFFQMSTVPLNESGQLVHLYSMVPIQNSRVVAFFYTVSFAYETQIPAKNITDALGDWTIFWDNSVNLTKEGYGVYTVWWTNNGWYNIKELPSQFKLVAQDGQFGLYEFVLSGSQGA